MPKFAELEVVDKIRSYDIVFDLVHCGFNISSRTVARAAIDEGGSGLTAKEKSRYDNLEKWILTNGYKRIVSDLNVVYVKPKAQTKEVCIHA